MEKLIIVAGSPNSGKTLSVNKVVKKLFAAGAVKENLLLGTVDGFWNGESGGAVTVNYNKKRIAVISYGDTVDALINVFNNTEILSCEIIVCCSHATRGKKVFEYMHNYIKSIDLSKTTVVPIYKNLLCNYGKQEQENECTANLIFGFLQ